MIVYGINLLEGDFKLKTAIALGTFDGVHIGHRAVIKSAASYENSIVVAFKEPPKIYFGCKGIILTDTQRKTELIKNLGIKKTEYLEFEKLKSISAESFLEMLNEKYKPSVICCGDNYTFGKDAAGNTELLYDFCLSKGIRLNVCPAVRYGGHTVSSTFIRELLKEGKVKEANRLLESDFSFCARVIHGDERGRTIGFPTANQLYPEFCATVKYGVYRTKALIDGKFYDCMSNIGIRPTYMSEKVLCESFVLNYNGNLYGKNIRIFLKDFIREEKRFSSLEELKSTISADCRRVDIESKK